MRSHWVTKTDRCARTVSFQSFFRLATVAAPAAAPKPLNPATSAPVDMDVVRKGRSANRRPWFRTAVARSGVAHERV